MPRKKKAAAKKRAPAPVAKKKSTKRPPPAKKPSTGHAERFERSRYELPLLDLTEAMTLAKALLDAKPPKASGAVLEESARIAAALGRAKAAARSGVADPLDAKAFDVAMDRAWETFVRRVQDHTELPDHPEAALVAKVYAIVQDLSILKLNYLAEFAQIGARLDALKREDLVEVSRRFTGEAFVDEVFRCHAAYGEALGVGAAPAADKGSLARGEARIALLDTVGEYVYQVLALARAGRGDTWSLVTRALAPILAARARAAPAPPPPPKPRAHPPVAPRTAGDTAG